MVTPSLPQHDPSRCVLDCLQRLDLCLWQSSYESIAIAQLGQYQLRVYCNSPAWTVPLASATTSIIFVARNILWRQNTSFISTKYACRDKTILSYKLTFMATKHVFCRNKNMRQSERVCRDKNILSRQRQGVLCRDKHVFVATKMIFVAAPANGRTEPD